MVMCIVTTENCFTPVFMAREYSLFLELGWGFLTISKTYAVINIGWFSHSYPASYFSWVYSHCLWGFGDKHEYALICIVQYQKIQANFESVPAGLKVVQNKESRRGVILSSGTLGD